MLEAQDAQGRAAFITLTYSEEKLPTNGSLVPDHFKNWLKRYRKRVAPQKVRFYGCGEYGDVSFRPHYHAAVFGCEPCRQPGIYTDGTACPCKPCSDVRETWGFGFVTVKRLELGSAQYIAQYVTKKMTHREDPRLCGREPEFARMSLKPGIGAHAMHDVASAWMQYDLEKTRDDVPLGLRVGERIFPLGKYLRKEMRKLCGMPDAVPQRVLETMAERLQIVREFAWQNNRSVASVFEEINGPYEARLRSRDNNNKRRKI